MTKLVWDKTDERLYKTGLDHGVLYVPDVMGAYNNGFAWNGLTSVNESFDDDSTAPQYFDGVKYLDSYGYGDFKATLSAFTYPDEFLEFEGMKALGEGLYVDDQESKVFGLSYRTLIGNQVQGSDYGYRIHILYHLTAKPLSLTFQNGSDLSEPLNFEWALASIPETVSPYRPTAHIILDSEMMPTDVLKALEEILYGSVDTNPRLPSLKDLLDFVYFWNPKLIMHTPATGLSPLVNGTGDLTQAHIPGLYSALPTTRLLESSVEGLYTLQEGL